MTFVTHVTYGILFPHLLGPEGHYQLSGKSRAGPDKPFTFLKCKRLLRVILVLLSEQ